MLLKDGESFFNDPTTGLRKIVSDIVSGWVVPNDPEVDPSKIGLPLENINDLLSQVDSIITSDVYNKWNNYKVAITNGSIFTKTKSSIISLYTFASYKEGMKTVSGPQFDLPNPSLYDNISWLNYDMGEPTVAIPWFSFDLVSNPVTGGYSKLPIGNLIVSSDVSAFGLNLENKINLDIDFLESINSSVSINSVDKMIYFIFKRPETIPVSKPVTDFVLYDYGLLDLATEMGWVIEGITT